MQNKDTATDYRLDGSQFLFWQFVHDFLLLGGAVACFAVSAYLLADMMIPAVSELLTIIR